MPEAMPQAQFDATLDDRVEKLWSSPGMMQARKLGGTTGYLTTHEFVEALAANENLDLFEWNERFRKSRPDRTQDNWFGWSPEQRRQVADQIVAKLAADGIGWFDNPKDEPAELNKSGIWAFAGGVLLVFIASFLPAWQPAQPDPLLVLDGDTLISQGAGWLFPLFALALGLWLWRRVKKPKISGFGLTALFGAAYVFAAFWYADGGDFVWTSTSESFSGPAGSFIEVQAAIGLWALGLGGAALTVGSLLVRFRSESANQQFRWSQTQGEEVLDASTRSHARDTQPDASESQSAREKEAVAVNETSDTKQCPDCAERVLAEARVCRYCGFRWAPPTTKSQDFPQGT